MKNNPDPERGAILELPATSLTFACGRDNTISKLVSAPGEIEDLLDRYAAPHPINRNSLMLQECHALGRIMHALDGILEHLERGNFQAMGD